MNVTFLGDALDFWKGCLFSRLRAEQLLRNLVVEPLLTDFQDWHPNEFALYAELLAVDIQVIHHEDQHQLATDRVAYLAEIEDIDGDVFLDPDTGCGPMASSVLCVRTCRRCGRRTYAGRSEPAFVLRRVCYSRTVICFSRHRAY